MKNTVKMKRDGYFGIGVMGLKYDDNYGTLLRTAQVFGADFIFIIGRRYKKQPSDSMNSWKHIPLFEYEDFEDFYKHLPYGVKLIAIELDDKAVSIKTYKHPKSACYLLGSEDWGLPQEVLEKCKDIVYLPGEKSLNVSVAGSITLFDRLMKSDSFS